MGMPSEPEADPAIEAQPAADNSEFSIRNLQQRIRQQELLSELGVTALHGVSLDMLLAEAARIAADGLRAQFSKVLQYLPAENRFLVRAGIGWKPGIVGHATIGADLASPAGYALRTGKPVISNHLENEQRFRTPEILRQHGIHRAMNVILQGEAKPFGVLEVDSKAEDKFVEHDLAFLQGAANVLGMAIERERHERHIKAALERQQVLLREMNHRVKNSLMIVSGLLQLQARGVGDPALGGHLEVAAQRVTAVAKAHEQLQVDGDVERMNLGKYVEAICRDLDASVAHCHIQTEADEDIEISSDRAVAVALIINELVTNAAKYAYESTTGGEIWITVRRTNNDKISISVRDEGAGLPPAVDITKPKRLGMRIVGGFVRQLNGTLEVHARQPGTEFVLTLPN
ncbi:MAG: GAF domain-containing protein [Alphaproteobacteria bacterium]|nr:GAF domain-containing protein [Alphaproteobacteria bacterium]